MNERRIDVDEPYGKTIAIRITGDNVQFNAMRDSISVYITEEEADRLSFHLQSILQDRELRKSKEGDKKYA